MIIDQARQNSHERIEVMFKENSGGSLVDVTPDACTLSLTRYYDGNRKLDTPVVVASGISVNLAEPCYYDLTPTYTAELGQYKALWVATIGTQQIQHTQYLEVVTNKTRYCNVRDVLEGIQMDIPSDLDLTKFIKDVENDMDLYLKKIYEVPVDLKSTSLSSEDCDTINNIATKLAIGASVRGMGLAGGQLNETAEKEYDEAWKKLMAISKAEDGLQLESVTKRAVSARRGVPTVARNAPSAAKTDIGFFDDPNRMGSQNMWRTP